jgi:GNAT superfamily N-acetyltransferase
LREILLEDVEGQELCISGFMVAEINGKLAGATCAWIEGSAGQPSGVLKSSLLLHFFGRDTFRNASQNLSLVQELSLERTPGSLQLESVFVDRAFRGLGVFPALLKAQHEFARSVLPAHSKIEIALMKDNSAALKSYKNCGFEVAVEKVSENATILKLLPSKTKILMTKSIR